MRRRYFFLCNRIKNSYDIAKAKYTKKDKTMLRKGTKV